MIYHSKRSSEFVGLRSLLGGRKQVVYETRTGQRVLLNISDPSASENKIEEALREGINARHVLGSVLAGLKARNIDVDFAT